MKFFLKNKCGFTLTEVMVGMTILTVAIVTATNLLVGLMRSNANNVKSLQAYYFAVEGIEAVRNIRDTNWMHNVNWLGDEKINPWGNVMKTDGEYVLDVNFDVNGYVGGNVEASDLKAYSPWKLEVGEGEVSFKPDNSDEENLPVFYRTVSILPYECGLTDCNDFVRIICKVTWDDGGKSGEVILEEILTDWKGGAI